MERLWRPKHLAITFGIFLALGGAGFGIAGVVAADDVPIATIFVPLPSQGDAGSYDVEAHDSWELPPDMAPYFEETSLEFHWFQDRVLPTQGGDLVLSNRLRYHTEPNQVNGLRGPIMQAGSNQPYAHEWVLDDRDDGQQVHMRYDFVEIMRVPCFLRNSLQGNHIAAVAGPLPGDMPCQVSGQDPVGPWHVIGQVPDVEPPVLVVEATAAFGLQKERITLWIQDGLPYPLRVETEWRYDGDEPAWTVRNYTFRSFVSGNETIAVTPERTVMPAMVETSWRDGPPTDRGLIMGFPLVDALEAARQQPGIATWLDEHPDAYLGLADHRRVFDDDWKMRETWDLAWTDGQDVRGHTVTFSYGPTTADNPAGGTIIVPIVPAQKSYEHQAWTPPTWVFPEPGQLDRGPTLASMRSQWLAVASEAGLDHEIHTWGFAFGCADCDDPSLHTWFGQSDSVYYDQGGPLQEDFSFEISFGQLLFWNGSVIESYQEQHLVIERGMAATTQTMSPQSVQQIDHRVWVPLSPAQAISITLGAALVAALYWLTPLFKTGMFGALFSRIQPDQVLEHPGRRTVYDAVLAEPGIHHSDLRRKVGMGQGTVTHHVDRLLKAGLLQKAKQGRYSVYFARGTLDHGLQASAGVLRAGPARKAFDAILAQPGIRSPDLLEAAGVKQSTLHYHLKRLQDQGLLESRRDGKFTTWWPTEAAQKVSSAIAA